MQHELRTVTARLDEHGRLIDEHKERISDLDRRTARLALVVYGDAEQEFLGLVERMGKQEILTDEFADWRRMMAVRWQTTLVLMRLGLILMGLTGIGAWAPVLLEILREIY